MSSTQNFQQANFQMTAPMSREGYANIKVIGVGGAGGNAVNRMMQEGIPDVEFIAVNTDRQALDNIQAHVTIQIGEKSRRGLGAGSNPEAGRIAAEESIDLIREQIEGTNMLFITAGMGGGTGTGASPVIAELAKDLGILTVAVVTRPFTFEGSRRYENAEYGVNSLKDIVDAILIVPNDSLIKMSKDDTPITQGFAFSDRVLMAGVRGISELVTSPGLINLDMSDVEHILKNSGVCHMGIGYGEGDNRASDAVNAALNSQLLETSLEGARRILVNFKCNDLTMQEFNQCNQLIREQADPRAEIIIGTTVSADMGNSFEITVIATDYGDDALVYTTSSDTRRSVFASGGQTTRSAATSNSRPQTSNTARVERKTQTYGDLNASVAHMQQFTNQAFEKYASKGTNFQVNEAVMNQRVSSRKETPRSGVVRRSHPTSSRQTNQVAVKPSMSDVSPQVQTQKTVNSKKPKDQMFSWFMNEKDD